MLLVVLVSITLGREPVLRDFFLRFIKIHILHHAAQEPVYGLALIQELHRHGYELSPGTLYPILHSLEAGGYLDREDRIVGGKVRKYYQITENGRQLLADSRAQIAELTHEVLDEEGPTTLPEPLDDDLGDEDAPGASA
jgi:PadR family transcriptional regulator, regulatory protein PadR